KIEFSDIIVNAGLRLDYFDPKVDVPADPTDPNIKAPLRSWLAGLSESELEEIWWNEVKPKVQISPRLGLAYPITDQGVIHISYGHFFQIPNFEHLYSNPEWELGNDIASIATMGNPDLNAEQTISYEIGLQQQLSANLKMNVDYYVRDVRGWINREKRVKARDSRLYDQYINSEFASIRGITLQLRRRFTDGYSFNVDYTFQIAEGTGSDPNAGISRLNSGKAVEKQILPLDWDRRHTLNAGVVLGNPGQWTSSFLMTLGSGLPYNAEAQHTPSPFLRNDGRKPFYVNVDFKATKTFQIFGFQHTVYTKINNILDILNETNVYGDSGRSTYTRAETIFHHGEFGQRINSLREYFNNPSRFSCPMRITVGYQLDF
ncbi:MAG: TonB-dependent receptor, partial [Candidatus Marinimicrobia bacterium]|nr:TonB-dependent receptor [Candidatus Neomarinimicrobiota bacterium]